MANTVTNQHYFEAIHRGAAPNPLDPNLFTADDIAAYMLIDSVAISSATSKAVSTVNAAAPDSSSISTASSKASSAGGQASIADSKAVSGSANTSVADSKAISVSGSTSQADSKAVSVANSVPILTVVANSQNVSTADSKAVSAGTVLATIASPAAVPGGGRTPTTLTSYIANNAEFNLLDYATPGTTINNFTTDATPAINAAAAASSAVGGILKIPPGTYKIVPNTGATDAGGATTIGITLRSNLHILAERGATFKLADNQSTDGSPKSLYMFFTSVALTNVSIRGLIMDMNGANNKISPNRLTNVWDVGKNMSHIGVSGDNARIDDMHVEFCEFLNTSGTNCIVAGQSNAAGITLGKRWTVAHNLFLNNGTDTSDHSCVYMWVDGAQCHDNYFWEDVPYGTNLRTGAQTAYEVHGAHQNVHDNVCYNLLRFGYLAGNNTSDVYNADIHDNICLVTFEGVAVFRSGANAFAVRDSRIHDNVITFIEKTFTGSQGNQMGFNVTPLKAISDIKIEHNHVTKPGVNTIPAILCLIQPTVAGVSFANLRVNGNTGVNLSAGVHLRTNGTNGGLGYVELNDNEFINFIDIGGTLSIGIYVDATNTIKTLVIEQNRFIDERGGSATFTRAIYMQSGVITDLLIGPQIFKGMTVAKYTETGGLVVTNRNGTSHVAGDYVLSAGWGTTASVSAVSARDSGGRVTITSNGTGQLANPTVVLTFKDKPWTASPTVTYGRGDINAPTAGEWRLTAISGTTATWTFLGLPVVATAYVLDFSAIIYVG